MSAHTRVVNKRRETITALPLYYSGQLWKKNTSEKDFKNYYGELRGATLFLYNDESQDTYIEKLDLEQLTSMESNCPYQRKTPTIFTLSLHTEEVQLKMDNPYTGEEWRAYILTMVKREIPGDLQLLPGQMMLLLDALAREKRRNPPASHPPLPPRPSFLPSSTSSPSSQPAEDHPDYITPDQPACFFDVTRQEAERMLEANPEYGGIIIRPSSFNNIYAVTIRRLTPRGPLMKNYRVACTNTGYVIELLPPVTVSSMNEVLKYFIEKTQSRPYATSEPYDFLIEDPPAPNCISITSPTPKTIPKAQVAPMLCPQIQKELEFLLSKPAEDEYVVPEDHTPDYQNLCHGENE
ncbi:signal-transducing adaptor protein 1 [Pleuronectes platessa]|uniref:signal-transducing adaptor protein 1 n=1 Tax=Pleuronectes platessa TaxID=8262 RepID=UPI00232A4767|nr:signal-transducing adaptor protein 1 [Pleuronectes platessa]XP_053284010.1 signal-transducing adaptor protein 1 [Pleuronectes platessa]